LRERGFGGQGFRFEETNGDVVVVVKVVVVDLICCGTSGSRVR